MMRRSFCLLCLLLPLGLLSGGRAAAQMPTEAYSRLAVWSSAPNPAASGRFRAPWGIDVDANGTIYIADSRLAAVHLLGPDGTPRALWGGPGSGLDLGAPRDIAVGPLAVYISDPGGDRVHVLGLDGTYQTSWSVAGGPGGLAYANGELYVTTVASSAVLILDGNGRTVRTWDDTNSSVQQPWGITVGPDRRVYVADTEANRVWIFNHEGVLLGGLLVEADGVQLAPLDVAVDSNLEAYVLTELVVQRQRNGVPLATFRTPGGRGLAVGPGSGLVLSVQDFRLGFTGVRHFADRRSITASPESWGGPFAPLGALEGPRRLSANADGRLFVLDTWPRIQGWTTDGTPRLQFGAGGLHDVAAAQRGSVFGIDGHTLTYWAEDGTELWSWQPPSTDPQQGNPYGWLTAADAFGGEVAVLDSGDQRLFVRDFNGNPVAEWPTAPPDGFESLADLALSPDRVYAIHRGRGVVEARARADGQLLASWPVPGTATHLDVDTDGSVYVLTRVGWVWKTDRDGRVLAVWPVGEAATDLTVSPGGRVYVSMGEAGEIRVYGPDPAATPPAVPTFDDRCRLTHDKTTAPTELTLGESSEIALAVEGECPLADGVSDILLLVDTSGSMSGTKMGAARSAALEFVGQLDYSRNQVGLITFSTNVELVQELTRNPRDLIRRIPDLGDDAGTNMLEAILMAKEEFASPRARVGARQVIVLLTDGRPNGGHEAILALANEFRSGGNEIYCIGLGLDVDRLFLQLVATQPGYYFEAPTEYDLGRVYDTVARRVAAAVLLAQVTVTDELPANMRYVPSSADPPAQYSSSRRTLTWNLAGVAPGGLRLRYRVTPQEVGRWPTNVRATADYIDGVQVPGSLTFPVPTVSVRAPERWSVFLPLLLNQTCPEVRTDVVLVLDTSSSMAQASAPDGPTKLAAAIEAARDFLAQLRLPRDRVAVVAFNLGSTLVQPLTGDQLALVQALDRLPTGTGTRIDLGLDLAIDELERRAPGHLPVIVLLTDGRQAGAPESTAVDAAARARAAGVAVFTIGLGSDADLALLARLAEDPSRAYRAAGEADLAAIYRAIADSIPCATTD
jgi:Mg-chelatase subunit ChlD/DNA-binding beta-propeller fold protein YncE